MEDSVSASDRKVKKEIRMRIPTTMVRCQYDLQDIDGIGTDLMVPRTSGSLGPLRRFRGGLSVRSLQGVLGALRWSGKVLSSGIFGTVMEIVCHSVLEFR